MNIKDLSPIILFSCFFANTNLVNAEETYWDSSPVGECFPKMRNGPKKTESTAVVHEGGRGVRQQKYVWIWDTGPGKNPNRALFEIDQHGKGCVILFLPASEWHDFKLGKGGILPKTVTSSTSVFKTNDHDISFKMAYRLEEKTRRYGKFPSHCIKVVDEKEEATDCKSVFQ